MAGMKYLLDSNIFIELLRGNVDVANSIITAGEDACAMSVITLYELSYGAFHSKHPEREMEKVNTLASIYEVLPLPIPAITYAEIQEELTSKGMRIDNYDLLIATTAIDNNLTLVTDNLKHFKRIDSLNIENWINR